MLNVFLTVDTELWPFDRDCPRSCLAGPSRSLEREFEIYIEGKTSQGFFGLPFQLATLSKSGLRATFFVEPLFADVLGSEYLGRIVRLLSSYRQEIGLHAHTEWLGDTRLPGLPTTYRPLLTDLDPSEQRQLLALTLDRLKRAGASNVCVFRAGNYAANLATLAALHDLSLPFDTSLNSTSEHSFPDYQDRHKLRLPRKVGATWEFPIGTLSALGFARHAQLCACSFGELATGLLHAWAHKWYSFVIVWHSSELLRVGDTPSPRMIHLRRFQRLCDFLGANKDKFATRHFGELDSSDIPDSIQQKAPSVPLRHTATRYFEQALSYFL